MRETRGFQVRVLIAGGGVAGLEALLGLRELAEERVDIDLLSPQRDFVYRPLAVAEPFGLGAANRFDLASIVEERGARFRPDALASVDPDRRVARTRGGVEILFDALVLASGARAREALTGAVTFWGVPGASDFRDLLAELEDRRSGDIVFAVRDGVGWPLPLYELAILTREHLARGAGAVDITIATCEAAPLELFGPAASETIAALLAERGIGLCVGCRPSTIDGDGLALSPAGHLKADRVVMLPRLEGRAIAGIPHHGDGFVPVDGHGQVSGVDGVYAAGDVTTFPVKQGGIAAQQADAVAEAIAARAGAPIEPRVFQPVVRGLLLTGREPAFLRAELDGHDAGSAAASHALWWPPGKIAGRYLAPHLAALAGTELVARAPDESTAGESVPVDVDLTDSTLRSTTGRGDSLAS